MTPLLDRFEGCLLGLMAGDCLGLPREGLSPGRAQRLFGPELEHRLLGGRGWASDDTELACFTAQALLAYPDDPEGFARSLGWKLRLWLLGLPAGVGLATARATLKLWLGFPPGSSGVWSAGNGAATRSPVLGLACREGDVRRFVDVSTRLTHTDPKALRGALAVALATRYAAEREPASFSVRELLGLLAMIFPEDDAEGRAWLAGLREGRWEAGPKGVSGYVYHTVPAALWAWLAAPFDFKGGMERIIRLGGDTDTSAAVFGAMCGAAVGRSGIPEAWLKGIAEYPRTTAWMRELAGRLHAAAEGRPAAPLQLAWPALLPRNLLFLGVVLGHGLRRLLPPY